MLVGNTRSQGLGGDLELDLEKVEGVHAEHGDAAGADPTYGLVLFPPRVSTTTPLRSQESSHINWAVLEHLLETQRGGLTDDGWRSKQTDVCVSP